MWKLVIGFIAFAALAVWMLSKGGDIDMGGEKHEISVPHTPATSASAPSAVVPAPVVPGKPASAPQL